MPGDFHEFLEFEFEVCFDCAAEVTATPATAFAVGDWAADCTSGGEEEKVDVGVDLRDDGEVDAEMQVKGFKWNVGTETGRS